MYLESRSESEVNITIFPLVFVPLIVMAALFVVGTLGRSGTLGMNSAAIVVRERNEPSLPAMDVTIINIQPAQQGGSNVTFKLKNPPPNINKTRYVWQGHYDNQSLLGTIHPGATATA